MNRKTELITRWRLKEKWNNGDVVVRLFYCKSYKVQLPDGVCPCVVDVKKNVIESWSGTIKIIPTQTFHDAVLDNASFFIRRIKETKVNVVATIDETMHTLTTIDSTIFDDYLQKIHIEHMTQYYPGEKAFFWS